MAARTAATFLAAIVASTAVVAPPRSAFAETPGATAASARVPLARFTTTYAHDDAHHARAFNVALAAEAIDGKVIVPGATFSFNDVVGDRTAAFGFAKSVVLRDRMLAEGTGGGTCQVASTLHAAALLAGLDIASRAPHSRPSAYVRMGLDATVVFGKIDLKLKNSRKESVVVHARATNGTLDVWLDADGDKPDVTVTSEIVGRIPFEHVVERAGAGEAGLGPDTVRVKAFGIPGFRVQRTREIRAADGTVRRDTRVDEYGPTAEALLVARDFDDARLARTAPSDDDVDASPARVPDGARLIRDERGAPRPTALQLRPSTRVVLTNGAP